MFHVHALEIGIAACCESDISLASRPPPIGFDLAFGSGMRASAVNSGPLTMSPR